jgi:DNA-binding CsgD family transcriptional regulator
MSCHLLATRRFSLVRNVWTLPPPGTRLAIIGFVRLLQPCCRGALPDHTSRRIYVEGEKCGPVVAEDIVAPDWTPNLERVPLLSVREAETFALLGAGWSNRRISARLKVTERTVKGHVAGILAKLEVESRLEAGLVALTYRHLYEGTVSQGVTAG